jgi:hypothetical protein
LLLLPKFLQLLGSLQVEVVRRNDLATGANECVWEVQGHRSGHWQFCPGIVDSQMLRELGSMKVYAPTICIFLIVNSSKIVLK